MDPRFRRHPDPTNDVIPDEVFLDMNGPFIQGFLNNVSTVKRDKMRTELAKADPRDRRLIIFSKQQGINGEDGNKLETVLLGQSLFGICDIMGMRPTQEDSVSCAVMPGFRQLSQAEQDLVAKTTFAKMQTTHGKDTLGYGSTMTVATAWKTPKAGGGYRVNTHTAYVGDSPAFIVVIKRDGTVVCKKLNSSPHHPDPDKGWKGESNYNQETERYELPRVRLPLTKAIGDTDAEPYGLTHTPTIDHDELDVDEEDKVLIVAGCDGMTEDLNDDAALEEVAIRDVVSAHRDKPVHEIAKQLAKRSAITGTKDNISCAVFEVTEECASVNVNDGHGGQTIARALGVEVYPAMLANIDRELKYKNKINELLSQVGAAATLYVDLGRENHLSDFRKLIKKLGNLEKESGQKPNEEIYAEMLSEVEDAFTKAEGKYRTRHPSKRASLAFVEAINGNADEYHYPRMLAIVLQKNAWQSPSPTWVEVKANSNFYVEKITFGSKPKQNGVIFNNIVDDILTANLTFTDSELVEIQKIMRQANPQTHLGLIALINDKLNRGERLDFDSSLIPQVINLMKLHDFLVSMPREMLSTPDYIRHIKSGKTDAEYYSGVSPGFGGDEVVPLTIMLLNKYHKAQIPPLLKQLGKLADIFPIGSAFYGITTLAGAATAISEHPEINFTPAELVKDIQNEQKKQKQQLAFENYLTTVESTSAREILDTLPKVRIAGADISAVDLRDSLQYIYTGTESRAERTLLNTAKYDNKMNDIINLVKIARDEYSKLGRSTHTKDFDKLIATLTRIATDNKDLKEYRMYAVIEAAYQKEQKPPMSISRLFRSDAENAEKFKEKINKNQTIFHYPRMLAVIMQQPALKQARETEEVRMNAAYNKVRPTLRTAYKKIAPITTDYRDLQMKLNENLQKILNIQDISKLAIRTREIDNAVNYGTTILPEKRINQIADILEKQTRFPSILIADMLNVMIEQMRDPWKTYTQEDVAAIVRRSCGADGKVDATLTFWGEMVEEKDIKRISKHLFDIIAPLKLIVTDDVSLPLLKGPNQAMRPAL